MDKQISNVMFKVSHTQLIIRHKATFGHFYLFEFKIIRKTLGEFDYTCVVSIIMRRMTQEMIALLRPVFA